MDYKTGRVAGVNGNLVKVKFDDTVIKNEVGYILVGLTGNFWLPLIICLALMVGVLMFMRRRQQEIHFRWYILQIWKNF